MTTVTFPYLQVGDRILDGCEMITVTAIDRSHQIFYDENDDAREGIGTFVYQEGYAEHAIQRLRSCESLAALHYWEMIVTRLRGLFTNEQWEEYSRVRTDRTVSLAASAPISSTRQVSRGESRARPGPPVSTRLDRTHRGARR